MYSSSLTLAKISDPVKIVNLIKSQALPIENAAFPCYRLYVPGKLKSRAELRLVRAEAKRQGRSVVFTNGCFDLLHRGHVHMLREAKACGDILIVAINSDRSVKTIKGPNRPVLPETDRAELIAAMEMVDYVVLFDEPDPYNLIAALNPDVLVKGGDWSTEKIIGADVVERNGGRGAGVAVGGAVGLIPPRQLLGDSPIAVGDPFSRIRFGWAADTIQAVARDRGYPFAEVYRSYDVNEDSLSARIGFDVQPGARARVDSVIVEGTNAIAPSVVRRMIPIHRGDWYSQRALYESQRDLYGLGVFGYVNVGLADSTLQGQDSSVAIRVQVAEARLHRVRAGAGFGTVDCFRALTSWSASNVLGGGRELDLTGQVSKLGAGAPLSAGLQNSWLCGALKDEPTERLKVNYNLTASFQEPFLFPRRTRGSLSRSGRPRSATQA